MLDDDERAGGTDEGQAVGVAEVAQAGEAEVQPTTGAPEAVPTDYLAVLKETTDRFDAVSRQLRHLESRYDRGDPAVRQEVRELRGRVEGLAPLAEQLVVLQTMVESLVPDEQRELLQAKVKERQMEARLHRLEGQQASAQPRPAPDAQQRSGEEQVVLQQVTAYAKRLNIDLNRLAPEEIAAVSKGVPQDGDFTERAAVLMENIALLARSRASQSQQGEDAAARQRQANRQAVSMPVASRGGSGVRFSTLAEADQAWIDKKITAAEYARVRASDLPWT